MASPAGFRGIRKTPALCFAIIACLLLFSCAGVPERRAVPGAERAECIPSFPDRDGWYGGDGAYSIRLDDARVLWLFGDTFVSDQQGRRDRRGMKVVTGTTLAVSTCTPEAGFRIRYFLKKRGGEFVSSFGNREWLWPQDPFLVDGTLYVPFVAIQADPRIPGPFKFRIAGHRMARIADFSGPDPNLWARDILDLTPAVAPGIQALATTSVVHDGHVYFFPLYRAARDGMLFLGNILARVPTGRLGSPAGHIEYLQVNGRWATEVDPWTVKIVLDAAVSEMSVRYHPETRRWIAVYMSLHNNGDRLVYRTAEALEGAWSEPRTLAAPIPEVDRNSGLYDPGNFCYAGKEHREFSRGGTLVATYVCNSHEDFEKDTSFIRNHLFLYRPVVVTTPVPQTTP